MLPEDDDMPARILAYLLLGDPKGFGCGQDFLMGVVFLEYLFVSLREQNPKPHIIPPIRTGVRDAAPLKPRQDAGGVQINDKDLAGPLAGPIQGHKPVDVLAGDAHQLDAGILSKSLDELVFKLPFRHVIVAVAAEGGALDEKPVYGPGRLPAQLLEKRGLAAMPAEITRIEETSAVSLNKEGQGAESGVVHGKRSDGE